MGKQEHRICPFIIAHWLSLPCIHPDGCPIGPDTYPLMCFNLQQAQYDGMIVFHVLYRDWGEPNSFEMPDTVTNIITKDTINKMKDSGRYRDFKRLRRESRRLWESMWGRKWSQRARKYMVVLEEMELQQNRLYHPRNK